MKHHAGVQRHSVTPRYALKVEQHWVERPAGEAGQKQSFARDIGDFHMRGHFEADDTQVKTLSKRATGRNSKFLRNVDARLQAANPVSTRLNDGK